MPRTKEFDPELAIEQAMEVFWRKGYEGTSVSDLMKATGLLKGSLYGTFGSKEKLFIAAMKRYGADFRKRQIKDQDALDYIQNFFSRLVDECSESQGEMGCLIMNSCIEFGRHGGRMAELSRSLFEEVEKNFVTAVERAADHGQLPPNVDSEELACRLMGGAFAVREIGKFKNDRNYLRHIANGVLSEIKISI